MANPQTMSGNVYLVEDNDEIRMHLTKVLRHYGLKVRVFANAAEFICEARYISPAVIVSDMVMPGKSGLDLLAHIREAGWACPVVFISGLSQPHQIIEAMKQGAADFLWKPFSIDKLLAVIRKALHEEIARVEAECLRIMVAERYANLTEREREVCQLIIVGHGNKEISEMIDVQPDTVKKHRGRVMDKMGATNLAELIALVKAIPINLG